MVVKRVRGWLPAFRVMDSWVVCLDFRKKDLREIACMILLLHTLATAAKRDHFELVDVQSREFGERERG